MAIALPGLVLNVLPHFLWPPGHGLHPGSLILHHVGTLLLLPGLLTMALIEGIVWVAGHPVVAYHFLTSRHTEGDHFYLIDYGVRRIPAAMITWLFYFVILSRFFRSEDPPRNIPVA
ncbi:MAG TPA: hypothetical protein VKR82_07040 [Candidatus Acidoferrales bacterium]|nr:hypothetical protein [Candidatus Acidoferrales bacterium]